MSLGWTNDKWRINSKFLLYSLLILSQRIPEKYFEYVYYIPWDYIRKIFWIYSSEYIVDIFGANLKFTPWFPLKSDPNFTLENVGKKLKISILINQEQILNVTFPIWKCMGICSDCHGYTQPAGFVPGFSGVRVWIPLSVPQQNLYPSAGYQKRYLVKK